MEGTRSWKGLCNIGKNPHGSLTRRYNNQSNIISYPQKPWETVAVDLFRPMRSSRHVIVLQDIGSRCQAAKSVSSAKADKVIPGLDKICAGYGYPQTQISGNDAPFNRPKMKRFSASHGITNHSNFIFPQLKCCRNIH